jgi:hypothetical protein
MTYKIVCSVIDNQVIVPLPSNFSDKKQVTVYIDDLVDANSQKLDAIKMAANDPLFLADIIAVQNDFDSLEDETL